MCDCFDPDCQLFELRHPPTTGFLFWGVGKTFASHLNSVHNKALACRLGWWGFISSVIVSLPIRFSKRSGWGGWCVCAEHQLFSLPHWRIHVSKLIFDRNTQIPLTFITSKGTNWNLLLHFTNDESLLKTEEWLIFLLNLKWLQYSTLYVSAVSE